MEIQQLRYVVALARDLHFLRAARRVHISQPTLSQQIAKLEAEIGAKLFERDRRRVRLTPEGERFVPYAQAVLDALERAAGEMRDLKGQIGGRLRVGAIPTVGPYLLPGVIRRMRTIAPQLTLEFYELTTSALLARLQEGEIDLGLLALPINEPGISSLSLGAEVFYLAVPQGHPFSGRKRVSADVVRRERILILQEGHCFRDQSLEFCHMPPESAQIVFQGSSLTSVMRLAAAGEGVTFVPHMAARPRENPGLSFVRFSPPEPTREIGMIWRTSMPLGRSHHAFLDAVRTALASFK